MREASACEPLMTCRKRIRRCQNRGLPLLRDQLGGCTETAQAGIRHGGGVDQQKNRLVNRLAEPWSEGSGSSPFGSGQPATGGTRCSMEGGSLRAVIDCNGTDRKRSARRKSCIERRCTCIRPTMPLGSAESLPTLYSRSCPSAQREVIPWSEPCGIAPCLPSSSRRLRPLSPAASSRSWQQRRSAS